MKLWLVVGSDIDGAWIDKDCIFGFKSLAEEKAEKLREAHKDMEFSVVDIDTPDSQENAIYAVADSIRANADALMLFSESIKEFVTCACSVNALGEVATNPTINIKKGDK